MRWFGQSFASIPKYQERFARQYRHEPPPAGRAPRHRLSLRSFSSSSPCSRLTFSQVTVLEVHTTFL